jgi:hypothetical protein
MTIALLRLYSINQKKQKEDKDIYHFIGGKKSPRKNALGKNPVTIDDYRATAFVLQTKKNRKRKVTRKYTISLM